MINIEDFFNYPRLGIPKSRGVKSFYIWGGVLFEKHGILKLRAVRPIYVFLARRGGAFRRVVV